MPEARRATEEVQRVGRTALRELQTNDFVSFEDVAKRAGVSRETVKRAFEWLRDQGAPVRYIAVQRAWALAEKKFALPLTDPTADDLQVALVAAGLLAELGQTAAAHRARALFEELAQRIEGGKARKLPLTSLRVTQTTSIVQKPELMLLLLRATRRSVVRIESESPWKSEQSSHTFEPWQVWIHDGVPYVIGYSRQRKAVRTFGLANIRSVAVVEGARPTARVPVEPWGAADPRFGIDNDRPNTAVLTFEGAVARWLASMRWHPRQEDVWSNSKQTLTRRLPYRSCRELARRLVAFGDGLVRVEPVDLNEEVARLARAAASVCRWSESRK